MNAYGLPVWTLILGLALMMVGGLTLWAYGARRRAAVPGDFTGPEAEGTRLFHQSLTRWFFLYGVTLMLVGVGLILWASSVLF